MPSVLVYRGETIANVSNRTRKSAPGWEKRPAWAHRASARYYEDTETRHYPVHAGLATHLIAALNTYYPPNQPSPRRCYRLGRAIREAVEN